MYSNIAVNKRRSLIIIGVFLLIGFGISYAVGYVYNDYTLTVSATIGCFAYALLQYYAADHIALSLSGACQVSKSDCPELWHVVENLSIASGMPMPKVYVIQDNAPNAFATGRNPEHSSIAVTTGLLDIMSKRELTAVLSHELSHVKNYDIRVNMIVFGLSCAIGLICDTVLRMRFYSRNRDNNSSNSSVAAVQALLMVCSILAPIVLKLLQLAISRQREYLADASGALMTRDPEGLANALEKIKDYTKPMQRQHAALAPLYFNDPSGKEAWITRLLSTHPPIDDRIKRLRDSLNKM